MDDRQNPDGNVSGWEQELLKHFGKKQLQDQNEIDLLEIIEIAHALQLNRKSQRALCDYLKLRKIKLERAIAELKLGAGSDRRFEGKRILLGQITWLIEGLENPTAKLDMFFDFKAIALWLLSTDGPTLGQVNSTNGNIKTAVHRWLDAFGQNNSRKDSTLQKILEFIEGIECSIN